MFQLSQHQIKSFQQKILTWYAENKRELPWREIPDGISLQERAYRILISEVMSQQTQLSRVIPKYEAWVKQLPTVQDLANASTSDLLTLWSGLGYNRRALYLQKAAQAIVQKFEGTFPQDEKILQTLPGIGEYTAKAIACFAFNKQIAVVDTNVRRVILTQFQMPNFILPKAGQISNKELQQIADQLLPHGHAYEWNQALMDYAAAVLKKEKIPVPRQSTFKDSDRFFRGQIIKLLIEKKHVTHNELHDYFNKEEVKINQERLQRVIASLLKDNLVTKNKEKIVLP